MFCGKEHPQEGCHLQWGWRHVLILLWGGIRRVMEAGVNLLDKAGCWYTKEHVCKISGQYIHFHRSYDSFCKVRMFVIYRPNLSSAPCIVATVTSIPIWRRIWNKCIIWIMTPTFFWQPLPIYRYREIHIDRIQFIFDYYANDSFKLKVLYTKRCKIPSEFIWNI